VASILVGTLKQLKAAFSAAVTSLQAMGARLPGLTVRLCGQQLVGALLLSSGVRCRLLCRPSFWWRASGCSQLVVHWTSKGFAVMKPGCFSK
jgi:hypothetical protein